MGTQGIIRVFDGETEILCLASQYDGYPEGLGREIADFCASKRVVNGINGGMRATAIANGAGCLAAQIVAHFKDGPGGFYIYPPGEGQPSYEYHVKCPDYQKLEEARNEDWKRSGRFETWTGLPITVEGYSVSGGWGGEPVTKIRVEIPDTTAPQGDTAARG